MTMEGFNGTDVMSVRLLQKPPTFFIIIFILIIFDIVGILGNILLVKVMNKSRSVNRSYGIYLIALAVTDSMNIIFNLVNTSDEFLHYHYKRYMLHRNKWTCCVYSFLSEVFTIMSAWLVVCLSVERFLVMYFPLRGRVWWKSNYVTVFLIVTALSVITQSPRLYLVMYNKLLGLCMFKVGDESTFAIAVSFDSLNRFIFVYAIPGATVFILNILVILRMYGFVKRSAFLRQQEYQQRYSATTLSSMSSSMLPPTVGDKTRRDRKRATGILLTVSGTYLVCMAPESIITFYWSVKMHALGKMNMTTVDSAVDHEYFAYFNLYRFIYQVFTVISYGSTFYTYMTFGKRFRKEVSSLWRITSTSSSLFPPPPLGLPHNHPDVVPMRPVNAFTPYYHHRLDLRVGNVNDRSPGHRPHMYIPRCNSDVAEWMPM